MKILLATDGSEYSDRAAAFLTRFNFSKDDEIAVLHALSWTPVMNEWESIYADLTEIRHEIGSKILDSTVNDLKSVNARISSSLVDGYPDKVIVDVAVDTGVDLVVMGARGLRGAASLIVGSVTKAVAVKSHNPVLIIKAPQGEISGTMKILFATDGSVHSDAMGKVLSLIPFPDDTEITILNAIATAYEDIPERISMEINDRIKGIVAGARETEFKESEKIIKKARENLSNRFSSIKELTKFGDPAEKILNTAETLNPDIIAVGSSGMRGIKGMLGSVSRYILNHSQCSVLIGKT
jgi:nucleotide-binding universal stress UspA family protein